jgi:hypothetical protein
MKIKLIKTDYHRNGICGDGFTVSIFDWDGLDERGKKDEPKQRMVAIDFGEIGQCPFAVFNLAELANGNIDFGRGNSWRGDHFAGPVREAIKQLETKTP